MTTRDDVIAEARAWLKTPYHDCHGIKDVGTDCGHYPVAVYSACGLMPSIDLPKYSPQFMMNNVNEDYLNIVLRHSREIPGPPEPGDFVLWKFGRTYSHGAIVIRWPTVIHARAGHGVVEEDVSRVHLIFRDKHGIRPTKFFTVFGAP